MASGTKQMVGTIDGYTPPSRVPAALRKKVFERDGYTCTYCGSKDDLTIDHLVARAAGGTNDESNLMTSCRSCNSRKGVIGPGYIFRRLTAGRKRFK